MLESLDGYLKKRAKQLGLERGQQLGVIQRHLDGLYPGQCRAVSLNEGVLKVTTPNASVASELRFKQAQITSRFEGVKKVIINIRS